MEPFGTKSNPKGVQAIYMHAPRRRLPNYTRSESVILRLPLVLVLLLQLTLVWASVAPTIDYSHNMRILKLPKWTPPGSLVYRLKGSDADPDTELTFGLSGLEARALLEVLPVAGVWNEADVYLRANLADLPDQTQFNLTLSVSDGNKTTQVAASLLVTEPSVDELPTSGGNPALQRGPFVAGQRQVFHVPENSQPNEPIGSITALESQRSDLPVRFELRGRGADKFAVQYVFGPRGQSRGQLVLSQQLDYERQNLFALQVLALNAWTDTRFDTRNIATLDIVVVLNDVQDTPPVFRHLPGSIRLSSALKAGAILLEHIQAEDGDLADQRPIQLALDANSPFASYFSIDKLSGQVRLTRPAGELFASLTNPGTSSDLGLVVFASETPDTSSYEHLWPPMYSRAEISLILVDESNEPPGFFVSPGPGSLTPSSGGAGAALKRHTLHGILHESSKQRSLALDKLALFSDRLPIQVQWLPINLTGSRIDETITNRNWPIAVEMVKHLHEQQTFVVDAGLGTNGTFELSLEGPDSGLFEVEPRYPVTRQTVFSLTMSSLELAKLRRSRPNGLSGRNFHLEVVARDFGVPKRESSRLNCIIELVEEAEPEMAPQFESGHSVAFSIYENAPLGSLVATLRLTEMDDKPPGHSRPRFNILEPQQQAIPFRIHPESGQLTLESHLDREKISQYILLVEARDLVNGLYNLSQVIIDVLDANDNAPVFLQSHYEAVLQPDGAFQLPLVVRALDPDEPGTANSQVVYEIIAGNQNELFAIDEHSGTIYPTWGERASSIGGPLPPALTEPIEPFASRPNQELPNGPGRIRPELGPLPNREVEETTNPPSRLFGVLGGNNSLSQKIAGWLGRHTDEIPASTQLNEPAPQNMNQSSSSAAAAAAGELKPGRQNGRLMRLPTEIEQVPALDLLLSLDSTLEPRLLPSGLAPIAAGEPKTIDTRDLQNQHQAQKNLPALTTLVVRAHDLGVPLRSSTVRVNIYNQALQSRTLSVILNGTAEQLSRRRESLERSLASLTGSRAQIESLEALGDSSSLSVARLRLSAGQHSLVDFTDLAGLVAGLDWARQVPSSGGHELTIGPSRAPQEELHPRVQNITTLPGGGSGQNQDVQSFAIESTNALERKLLVYIVIVSLLILILLLIWMVYSCSRENQQELKMINISSETKHQRSTLPSYRPSSSQNSLINPNNTQVKRPAGAGAGSKLLLQAQTDELLSLRTTTTATANKHRPDHLSMYNGQVWFEPRLLSGRRASSAPSPAGGSLDTALQSVVHGSGSRPARLATGEFFPNTIGYMENLAALGPAGHFVYPTALGYTGHEQAASTSGRLQQRRRINRRQRVFPAADTEAAAASSNKKHVDSGTDPRRPSHSLGSSYGSSQDAASGDDDEPLGRPILLDSDQELLGFDSTGTPIIATHTKPRSSSSLVAVETNPRPNLSSSTRTTNTPASKLTRTIETASKTPENTTTQSATNVDNLSTINDARKAISPSVASSKIEQQDEILGSDQKLHSKSKSDEEKLAANTTADHQNLDNNLSDTEQTPKTNQDQGKKQLDSQLDLMSELNNKLNQRRRKSNELKQKDIDDPSFNKGFEREAKGENRTDEPKTSKRPPLRSIKSLGHTLTEDIGDTGHSVGTSKQQASGPKSADHRNKLSETNSESCSRCSSAETSASQVTSKLPSNMNNRELLEKQSIFAMTYSGLATNKPPTT